VLVVEDKGLRVELPLVFRLDSELELVLMLVLVLDGFPGRQSSFAGASTGTITMTKEYRPAGMSRTRAAATVHGPLG
jgi:hypothetical protein